MSYEVLLAAVFAGLAIYSMRWGFSFGSHKIYLPKDRKKWLFFDRLNEKHPDFFRIFSSIFAFFSVVLFANDMVVWVITASLFAFSFVPYAITCMRSYYLVMSKFSDYYED